MEKQAFNDDTRHTEHLEVEGGRSSRTAENYEHYLNRLVDFAGTIYVEDITQELIRKYRLWLNRHINTKRLRLN